MVSLGRQDSSPPCQAMSALHAVPLTAPIFLRPSLLPPCKQDEQSNFHSPYTLPSSVSCKSSACHSYENTGGVGVFFPFWNSLVGCWGFDPSNECLSKSSTDCRQLSHCRSCFKSFRCNTYASPRKCCKQRTYGLAKPFRCNTYKKPGGTSAPSTFRFFDVQMCSLHPKWGYGTRGQHVFESPACRDPGLLPSSAPQCYHSEET